MSNASDFRQKAREALRGKWVIAVIAGLIASLLGALSGGSTGFSFGFEIRSEEGEGADLGTSLEALGISEEILVMIVAIIGTFALIAVVFGFVQWLVGSAVGIGYSQFNLDLIEGREINISTLFSRFDIWKTAIVAQLLCGIYIALWTLLFIIPGIMKAYSYSMLNYVLAENPELSPSEALKESERIMKGNRWRLFCLEISFIGWAILSIFTLGLGSLWLVPYQQASIAAFYREITSGEAEVYVV